MAALAARATCPEKRAVTQRQSTTIEVLIADLVFELEAERSTHKRLGKRVTTRHRDA